jgi:hypothetical protein
MAGNYNINAERGETFSRVFTWKDAAGNPVNLTGFTAKMEVRTGTPEQPGSLLLSFTTANGRIILGAVAGTITLAAIVADIDAIPAGVYCYDIFLTGSGVTTRLLEGQFKVIEKVTQA